MLKIIHGMVQAALCCACLCLATARSRAGDWPQILGPSRDGHAAADETLRATWGPQGPKQLWKIEVGQGYAGVAVAEEVAVVFHRQEDEEVVEARDAAKGTLLWRHGMATQYQSRVASDHGPRCVPVIHSGQVIAFGASGRITCLRLKDGTVLWERQLYEDFNAPEGYFGAGSTPLVEGNLVIVNVGGAAECGLVALNMADGSTAWQSVSDAASYSSPIAVTWGGKRLVLAVTRLNCFGVDPATGSVAFSFPFGMRGPTVNAATPLAIEEGSLFVTASYGVGAKFVKLAGDEPQVVWQKNDVLSSQYSTPVLHDGYLYGIDGREDFGPAAALRCINPQTGEVAWSEDDFGTASVLIADGKLLMLKVTGELVLAEANPQKFRLLAKASPLSGECRALPALANGRLYIRGNDVLKCLEVR